MDPHYVANTLAQNQVALRSLAITPGMPVVHRCDGQASVSVWWIHDLIYFSAYWIAFNASEGPHFMVRADLDHRAYSCGNRTN